MKKIYSYLEFVKESYSQPKIMSLNLIKMINRKMIDKWGGKHGIRDKNQLNSIISRPLQSVFGEDAFHSMWEKIGALMEGIIKFHPFTDGNKRTAWHATKHLLKKKGYHLKPHYDEARPFIVEIAESKWTIEEIGKWLKENSSEL
jgi:death-on-curing protein